MYAVGARGLNLQASNYLASRLKGEMLNLIIEWKLKARLCVHILESDKMIRKFTEACGLRKFQMVVAEFQRCKNFLETKNLPKIQEFDYWVDIRFIWFRNITLNWLRNRRFFWKWSQCVLVVTVVQLNPFVTSRTPWKLPSKTFLF